MKKRVWWLLVAVLGAAVFQELRKPAEERTWEGQLGGVVPYDLRPPARVRAAFWAPEDPRIFTPRVMGVGWSINVGRLVAVARRRADGQ